MALTTNLQAFYNLSDTSDASGGGFTLTNNNSVTFVAGLIGNCAELGVVNINKTLTIANNLGVSNGNAVQTITGWVNFNTLPAVGVPMYLVTHCATGASGGRLVAAITNSAGTYQPYANVGSDSYDVNAIGGTVSLATGAWHFFVTTFDGVTLINYWDNVQVNTVSATITGSTAQATSFEIGGDPGNTGRYASVKLDIVGYWNRVLTGPEMTSLYNGGAGLEYPFTVSSPNFLASLGVGT